MMTNDAGLAGKLAFGFEALFRHSSFVIGDAPCF
jgi:hypothetical protein